MRSAWIFACALACACHRGTSGSAGDGAAPGDAASPDGQSVDAASAPGPGPLAHCAPGETPPVRLASAADRQTLFERLAGHAWEGALCGTGGMLAPTCHRLVLHPDGTFTWSAVSDYPERGDAGHWNFVARDDHSGTFRFSTGDSVLFSFRGDDLDTGRASFRPGGVVTLPPGARAEALPAVPPPDLESRLAGTCWRKSNEFDLDHAPEGLAFGEGVFRAAYRGGACAHGGVFAVDDGHLLAASDGNTCGQNGTSVAQVGSGERPDFIDDLLLLSWSSYFPAAAPPQPQVFIFDSYRDTPGAPFGPPGSHMPQGSVRVSGRFQGPLRRNRPTRISFTLENVSVMGAKLDELAVEARPATPTSNGYTPTGEATVLARALGGARLEPGQRHQEDWELVLPAGGERTLLTFRLRFRLYQGGSYPSYTTHVARLAPEDSAGPDGGSGDAYRGGQAPDLGPDLLPAPPPPYEACGTIQGAMRAESLALAPDGQTVAIGVPGPSSTVMAWKTLDGQRRFSVPVGGLGSFPYGLAFSSQGWLAASDKRTVRVLDASDGSERRALTGHHQDVRVLATSEDGARLASGSFIDGEVKIWSAAGALERTLAAHQGTIFALAFGSGDRLATGGGDNKARLWRASDGQPLHVLDEHTQWVSALGFSRDGARLASGALDGSGAVWSTSDGKLLRIFQAESAVRLLSFTADGTLIAFSERGGIAFHPPAGGPPALLPISTDPNDWVQLAAATPDATRLATVNYSGTIRLWCRR
jgi:hypothetical protein